MTEPTDGELDAVLCNQWPAFSMQATLVRVWVRAAMRDALAKWGTPPAGVGLNMTAQHGAAEPTQEMLDELIAVTHATDDPMQGLRAALRTQQPTQAQAVPLTQAQVVEAFYKQPHPVQFVTAFDQGVRFAEKHHSIKGGQHGAE